jgi:hypothetical protein
LFRHEGFDNPAEAPASQPATFSLNHLKTCIGQRQLQDLSNGFGVVNNQNTLCYKTLPNDPA